MLNIHSHIFILEVFICCLEKRKKKSGGTNTREQDCLLKRQLKLAMRKIRPIESVVCDKRFVFYSDIVLSSLIGICCFFF